MRLLTVAFSSSDEFLANYSDASVHGSLFCRTRASLSIGVPVLLEVMFPQLPNHVLLRGWIASPPTGGGVWVRFDPADQSTRHFLVGIAQGRLEVVEKAERSHRRIPATVPVTCEIDEVDERAQRVFGDTQDLGAGGVFIRSPTPPRVGTHVSLVIGPLHNGDRYAIDGRVAWVRIDQPAGFGVRFDPRARDNRKWRSLLRRSLGSGRVQFRSDCLPS